MEWLPKEPRPLFRILVPIAVVGVAGAIRVWGLGAIGPGVPFVTFYPAIMVAALYGGFVSGILATVLSGVFAQTVILHGSLVPVHWTVLGFFLVNGVLISSVFEAVRRSRDRLHEANERLKQEIAERRRAEDALRQSEASAHARADEVQALMDAIPAFTFIAHDSGCRRITTNRAVEELMGVAKGGNVSLESDEAQRTAFPGFSRGGRALSREELPLQRAASTGQPQRNVELTADFGAGERRELVGDAVPLFDEKGAVRGAVGAFVDVTERSRAVEALRESELRFRGLSEHSLAGVFIFQDSRLSYVNPTLARMAGYEREELIGRDPLELFQPGDRERAAENLRKRMAGNLDAVPFVYRVFRKDGGTLDLELLGARMELNGRPALIGNVLDVTERVRSARRLAESERRFRTLMETVGLVAVMLDLEGRITFCNDSLLSVTGYTAEEILGRDWFDLFVPGSRPDVAATFRAAVRQASIPPHYENPIRTRSGEERLISWNNVVLRDTSGDVVGTASIGEDVTDRRAGEEEIRRLNAELESRVAARTADLEAAVREMEAFSYSVSHDLRAPVRAIDGFAKILADHQRETMDEEGRRLLATIQKNSHRMGTLIDELLHFSRTSRTEMKRTPVDMARLAREALAEVLPDSARERGSVHIAELPQAYGDVSLLRLALHNLLSNAVKFSRKREQPRIDVGYRLGPGGPEYFVRDNGAGFNPKYVHKLFGVFERLHSVHEFDGTGIGLALVKRIVERHGGRVWAEGEVDKGATFWFTLGPDEKGARPTSR